MPLIEKYEPIEVLNLIEKNKDIDKRDIYDFLKDFLDLGNNDFEIHKKIINLSKIIITTNYDTTFEKCDNELSKRVAYIGKNFELATHKDKDKKLLFKLHGCFKDSNSMVLFPTNYNSLYNKENRDATHTLTTLKNLVINKNILFIGCGMGDFQINHIFREVKKIYGKYNENHFIISNTRPDSELNFLTHISITNHNEINTILDSLIEFKNNIEIEKNKENEEKQKQIDNLKKQLREKENNNEQLINELFQEALNFENDKEHEKAITKYNQISYLGECDSVYYNWGNSLYNLAKLKTGIEKEKLLLDSCSKYEKATQLDENNASTFYN